MAGRWLVAVALCLGLCGGCAAKLNRTMASWMDHPVSELIASWGPPDQVFGIENGGRLLLYTVERNFGTVPGQATTTGSAIRVTDELWWVRARTEYRPPETLVRKGFRAFWVDARGRIYRWQWKGY